MTQGSSSTQVVSPRVNVSFLQSFQITHGPVGLLGRFFLNADRDLREAGIELSFATFEEVADVQKDSIESWPLMNPMFDPAVAELRAHETFCIVGRKASGQIVATCSGKYLNATTRSFAEIVNAGDFFSVRPERNDNNYQTRMVSALADKMHGHLGYSGGLWIHPDTRGLRLPATFCRLVTATMLTLWNVDYTLGLLDKKFIGSAYHKRYGYRHEEPTLTFTGNGKTLLEAMLLWMTADETVEDLVEFLDILWPEINPAVVRRRGHHTA